MAEEVRLVSVSEERDLLTEAIREARPDGQPVRLLEAGCGHYWALHPENVPLHITGVDLDRDALKLRREKFADLDEEIYGDIRTVDLPENSFDVVYCSFLLEHVENAEQALDQMVRALRPGGTLLIRVPDGDSLFGFLAKRTPHRSHVLYRRHIERRPHAGEPGHAPYPTVYDKVVSVRGMRAWAQSRDVKMVDEYCTNAYLKVFGRLRGVVQAAVLGVAKCTGGRISGTHNNVGFVMRKAA